MPIRTVPVTPEQKFIFDSICGRYYRLQREHIECEKDFYTFASSLIGPFKSALLTNTIPAEVEVAQLSADGQSIELLSLEEYESMHKSEATGRS